MKTVYYDLMKKSILPAKLTMGLGILLLLFLYIKNHDSISSFQQFLNIENSSGDKIGIIFMFVFAAGLSWFSFAKTVMDSLKKAIKEDELKN